MEISNEGAGQDFSGKLNVGKIQKWKENVSYIYTITAKERHLQLHSHRYIFQYTALYTCRIVSVENLRSLLGYICIKEENYLL